MNQNILFQYLEWHFSDEPKNILRAWQNFLKFNLNYFSTPLLLKTLFSPWRRYSWPYPRGLEVGKWLEAFLSNLISRLIGAAIRIIFIFLGLSVEIFLLIAGFLIFVCWFVAPLFLIAGVYYGLKILL